MIPRLVPLLLGCALACSSAPPPERTAPPPPAPLPVARAKPIDKPVVEAPAEPAPPPAPPYDLEADITARGEEARRDLGAKTKVEVVEDVFVVAAAGGGGSLAGAIAVTKKALAAYFNERFSKRPERAISVYLFAEARSYDAYCKKRWGEACSTPYGFYLHDDRRIVMNVAPGIGTLTHELVHPLVETDFPSAPDWINEGIASLYERFYLPRPGEIRGGKNWRHPRLVRALNSKKEREHARLPVLFGMSDRVFRGEREDLNYAAARYLCQWLDQKDLLWPFYRRWRDGYEQDPTGEKAFTAVVGKTPAEADEQWARWVRNL
jgi:hypothetical protein